MSDLIDHWPHYIGTSNVTGQEHYACKCDSTLRLTKGEFIEHVIAMKPSDD